MPKESNDTTPSTIAEWSGFISVPEDDKKKTLHEIREEFEQAVADEVMTEDQH